MNEYSPIAMIYISFQIAMLAWIRYWLYKDDLRVPIKKMYFVTAAILIGGTLVWIITGGIPGVSYNEYRLFNAGFMFTLSCYIIRVPFAKHAYTYSLLMVYDFAIEVTAFYAQIRLMPGPRGWVYVLVALVLLLASFVWVTRYLKWMINKLSLLENDKIWSWLCVISYSFIIMNLVFTFEITSVTALRGLLSRYLMLIGVVGLYAATAHAISTMNEASQAKLELTLARRQVALQESYYARLVSQMDDIKRIRHDYRHHRAAISALVQKKDLDALSEYMGSAGDIGDDVPLTGNLACDSVLLYYLNAADKQGARVETEIKLASDLPVSTPDLCVILGNLLENAVEAGTHVAPELRYIRVAATGDADSLFITVDNRFDKTLKMDSGEYISRKEGEGHGIGISSVRFICEKYDGVLRIETEDDMFMAGVAITR